MKLVDKRLTGKVVSEQQANAENDTHSNRLEYVPSFCCHCCLYILLGIPQRVTFWQQ